MTLSSYTATHGTLHYIEDHRGHIAWRLGSGNTVELFSITASQQRKGYGRSLVRQMLCTLKDSGIHTVYGFTRERLVHAQLFYKSVGFNLIKLPGFYAEGNAVMFSQNFDVLCAANRERSFMNVYSQNGEDAILHRLLYDLDRVGSLYAKTFVEIGVSVEEGFIECNTGRLLNQGWTGHWIDEDAIDHPIARQCHILPNNINGTFKQHNVPEELGVLSIDVDGIDYYLWEALSDTYQPAIVVIEYNSQIPNHAPLVVPYSAGARWDGTCYFGANALALINLAHDKGYKLYADARHVNLIFVRNDLAPSDIVEPNCHSLTGAIVSAHPPDPLNRKYITPRKRYSHAK